jgi:hypothetical protein
MTLRDKIKRIGEENPDLDAGGYRTAGEPFSENDFRDPSDAIEAEIEEALRYLTRCEKVDRFNPAVTSGSLKDYATYFSNLDGKRVYVRNGCLIVAAMIAGFAVKQKSPTWKRAVLNIGFHALPPHHWQQLGRLRRSRRQAAKARG